MTVVFDEDKQNRRVEDLKKREAENLTQVMAEKYGIPYLDLSVTAINIDALRVIKESEAEEAGVVSFNLIDKKVSLGVLSPENPKTKEAIAVIEKKGYIPTLYMVSLEGLKKVLDRYKDLSFSFETKSGALDISNEEITNFLKEVHGIDDIKKLIEDILKQKKSYKISKLFEIIIAGALATKASDIHLEPEEAYVRLRYRLDGVLVEILTLDLETFNLLLSRIKLLSGLKLNVKEKAQDGRFSIKLSGDDIEIRTSALPGAYNESIVLRVLNPKSISVPLEELGIHPKLLAILLEEMEKPNGLILNTGPTGSGKTTTLYAFLKKMYSPEIKIITIENPIEYHLPGIVQTQTNEKKGYNFSEGLRSALRQDPDVIMVGEIRDGETAEIAINSALTGHLVFSTLHTNNAAGTYPRLIDLGVNPKTITSAINIAMAQRLVRKLCVECKKEVLIEGETKTLVEKITARITDRSYLEGIQTEKMWKSVGCDKCNKTGYRGRLGIYEAIKSDQNIENAVKENPSEREITKAAEGQGIPSMVEDGILKMLQGITSLDELNRVVEVL
ncbi:MAG: type II/IV secretion system protein [Parcubacteria group bacterium]|nr:type II/IV secretion system protein [Parcubacteria group bacterium]